MGLIEQVNRKQTRVIRHNIAVKFAFCFLVILLLSVASAHAYDFPPYEGLRLKVLGNISESYSNNITYSADNESKVEDYYTAVTLGLDLRYEGKRDNLGLSGKANSRIATKTLNVLDSSETYSAYISRDFSKHDKVSINGTFFHNEVPGRDEIEYNVSECRAELALTGRNSDEIEAECSRFGEEFRRLQGKYDTYRKTLNTEYNKSFSDTLSMRSSYTYRLNETTRVGTTDSTENNLYARMQYRYTASVRYSLIYGLRNIEYEDGEKNTTNRIAVGLITYFTKRTHFDGSVGLDYLSQSGVASNFIELKLKSDLDTKTRMDVAFKREEHSVSDRKDVFRNWQIEGNLNRQFYEDLNLILNAFYGNGSYIESGVTNKFFGGHIALTHNFWENKKGAVISGKLGYTYSNLDSSDATLGYSVSLVNVGLTAGF